MKHIQEQQSSSSRKVLSVMVIIDNRESNKVEKQVVNNQADKSHSDFRSSAFKETEVDPLEFPKNQFNTVRDQELLAELNRRICDLEYRVQKLESKEGEKQQQKEEKVRVRKHKIRRKNWEMKKDRICPHCAKNYGTETALKYHIKLKHEQSYRRKRQEL